MSSRIRKAIKDRGDIDIYWTTLGYEARIIVSEGNDGYNYEYVEAKTVKGLLKKLLRILE